MNKVNAMDIVRDSLRTNLVDAYTIAGGSRSTQWIYSDEPILVPKFPQIELKEIDNPSTVIEIGSDYMEHHQLFINIWFSSKNGFKITVDGVEYTNARLVKYYQGLIETTLKAQFNNLHDVDVGGYKHTNTSNTVYDPETQLYSGNVTIRVWYFHR